MGNILLVIAFIVYVGMLVHAYMCKGDIDCLSDLAYDKHKWLFPALMGIMSFCLFVAMIDKTPADWQFLCFMAMSGCFGVGFTPCKESENTIAHYICATLAMGSIVALWLVSGYWWMPFLFCLAGLRSKWLLGVELGILASAFAYALI